MRTRRNVDQRSSRGRALAAAVLLLGSAAVAGAQTTQVASTDGRWAPWIGCWQASGRDAQTQQLGPSTPAPIVCIVPGAGSADVDLVTVNGAQVSSPERVDANGTRRAVNREGCEGWETAEFSPDASRIYLRSEHQCSGNRTRTSTGIMSITPNGEWLDVQGVKVEGHSAVRVVHYGRIPVPAALGADMRATLEGQKLATTTATLAAADSVRIADVLEATKKADPLVVQTWLAQRGQGFNLDAKRLEQLADAKIPSNVIDVMVALSYPRAFAINLAQSNGTVVPTDQTRAMAEADEGLRSGPVAFMNWDPFYSSAYGYGYYSRYGLYGMPGYGYPGYWYQGRPVVITRPSNSVDVPAQDNRGRMVKGSGYTRPRDYGGDSGTPRGSTSGGARDSGGSSAGSSGGASKGSSEPRTAKPRP